MFENLSDEHVLDMLRRQGEACERIMAMPEEERRAPGKKGEASPEQAGAMNALFATLAQRECERRGLVPQTHLI